MEELKDKNIKKNSLFSFLKVLFKFFIKSFFLLLILIIIIFFFVGLTGDKNVLQTVIDNSSLPSIEINGVKLHSQTFGNPQNSMVVVLHGGPGGDYRSLLSLRNLSDEYFVVFYDQRGAGLSQRIPFENLSTDEYLNQMTKELLGVINYYKSSEEQKVYLIGHSWGGMLASAFLGEHPEMVEKVVLAEPGFLNETFFEEFYIRTNGLFPKETSLSLLWFLVETKIRSLFIFGPDKDASSDFFIGSMANINGEENPTFGYYCEENPVYALRWRFGAKSLEVTINKLVEQYKKDKDSFSFDITKKLDEYDKPVLFLVGSCNSIIGEDIQIRQSKIFPNSKIQIIQNAGHEMFFEKPQESLNIVSKFFNEEI
jgi:proline iminopeptidase